MCMVLCNRNRNVLLCSAVMSKQILMMLILFHREVVSHSFLMSFVRIYFCIECTCAYVCVTETVYFKHDAMLDSPCTKP